MIKEVIGNAILYNADCLEALEEIGPVSHVITDPPYEEAAHSSQRRVYAAGGGLADGSLNFAQMTEELREAVAKKIIQLTSGWGLFFCQLEGWQNWRNVLEKHGAQGDHPMVWYKPDGKPRYDGTGPAPSYEIIELVYCGDGRRVWNGGGMRGVFTVNWNEKRDEGNTHQTIKPQKLMRELVGLFSNENETILDTFMGSGSTGVAAVTMGRKFIGIERDPEYFEVCCKRIEAVQSGMMGTHYVRTKARAVASMLECPAKAAKPPPKPRKALAPPLITAGTQEKPPAATQVGQEGPAAAPVAQVSAKPKTAHVKPPGLVITAGTAAIKEPPVERSISQNTGLVRKPWGVK